MVTARGPEAQVVVSREPTRTRTAQPDRSAVTALERVLTSPFGMTIALDTSDVSSGKCGEMRKGRCGTRDGTRADGPVSGGPAATTRHTVES